MTTASEAVVWRLNQLVDRHCIANGIPLFGHDPSHRCSTGCVMLGNFPGPFICASSRQLHFCGRHCKCAVDTGEGTVCTLTGYQVADTACAAPMIVRDSSGRSTRHWGNASVKKGSALESKATVVSAINKALRMFLCGDTRKELSTAEHERYNSAVTKLCRKLILNAPGQRPATTYARIVVEIGELARKHEASCRPPVPPGAAWIDVLAPEIYRYWKDVGALVVKKTAVVITAVALSLLASPEGFSAEGVTYVEHSDTVAQHSIPDVMFGRFPGITCRRMSILQREMMGHLQTSSGRQRIIEPLRLHVGQ